MIGLLLTGVALLAAALGFLLGISAAKDHKINHQVEVEKEVAS